LKAVNLVNRVTKNWHRKEEEIWKIRGGKQEFLYSK